MDLVIKSALSAIEDLRAPGMMKLFLIVLAVTFVAASIVVGGGVALLQSFIIPLIDPIEEAIGEGWLGAIFSMVTWAIYVAAFIVPAFLIFWSLMIFIASFFDERIAEKIEAFRYPKMAMGQSQPFMPELWQDVRFALKTIFLNLLLILIPIFWPFWPILFPLLNAYLLGMYFFTMAGGRHVGKKQASVIAKQNRWKIIMAGLLIVFASGIPFLNLIVPFWGVAMMVHLYHAIGKPPIIEQITDSQTEVTS